MKTRFFYILSLLLCQTLAWADPAGTGTATDPYKITSKADLTWFSSQVSNNKDLCAKLTANIDYNDTWTPLAAANTSSLTGTAYNGTFDGNGYYIKGLTQDYSTYSSDYCLGFVGHLGASGVIKNLTLIDCSFKGKTYVGGICGYNDGTITTCAVSMTKTNIYIWSNSGGYAGGICGYNNKTVINCYCNSMGSSSDSGRKAAIAGYNSGTVSNCYTKRNAISNGTSSLDCAPNCTDVQFTSGEIAYKLQHTYTNKGMEWTETIGQDSVPCFGHKTVYHVSGDAKTTDIVKNDYVTRWYPVNFTLTNAKAYTVKSKNNDNSLVLVEFTNADNKNVPLVITTTQDGGKISEPAFDIYINDRVKSTDNLLVGTFKEDTIPYSQNDTNNNYLLQTLDGTTAFYLLKDKYTKCADSRCFLQIAKNGNARDVLDFTIEDDPTAIESVAANTGNQDTQSQQYNILGQKTNSMRPGLYIINHKKVLKR